jgi:hypothetical protein
MGVILLAVMAASSSTFVRVDVQDRVQLEGPAPVLLEPLVVLLRAPASWVEEKALTAPAKTALFTALYGRPDWQKTYQLLSAKETVLDEKALPAPAPGQRWYEVDAKGTVTRRSGSFEPLQEGPPRKRLADAADGTRFWRGPGLDDGAALHTALASARGLVKVPITLERPTNVLGVMSARAGALTLRIDDTRLGVPLSERIRGLCASAVRCTVWLVGTFAAGTEATLTVSRVGGVVEPAADLAVWLEHRDGASSR